MPDPNETIQIGTLIVGLVGGLALFLFGMDQMTDALKTMGGSRMKSVLDRLTANRFTATLAGAFITAILQSSSVTTVLVIGFITAGLMALAQSVGVILGANIGTTITAQIIALNITRFGLALVAIGFGTVFTARGQRQHQIGSGVLGLGLMLFGMTLMSDATRPLRTYLPFMALMESLDRPAIAMLAGTLFTAVIQSSAATTGVVIVLAAQGLISLETGIALALGANIGTCVTALLASLGKPRPAVQAAAVHIFFNVAGVLLWIPFIVNFAELVRAVSPAHPELTGAARIAAEAPRQIANAHTLFNVINALLFLPFTTQIARLVQWLIPDKPMPAVAVAQPVYLDNLLLDTPDLALDRVRLELVRLGRYAMQMLWSALPAVLHGSAQQLDELARMDDEVDQLQAAVIAYLGRLSQENLLHRQTERVYDYLAVATYLENIADMVETNLVEAGRERLRLGVTVSQSTQDAMRALHARVAWSVQRALEAVDRDDKQLAQEVIDAKAEITRLATAIDDHLAHRLVASEPNRMQAFRIESDVVENFRRIYYFAKRIAKATVEEDTVLRRTSARAMTPELAAEP